MTILTVIGLLLMVVAILGLLFLAVGYYIYSLFIQAMGDVIKGIFTDLFGLKKEKND